MMFKSTITYLLVLRSDLNYSRCRSRKSLLIGADRYRIVSSYCRQCQSRRRGQFEGGAVLQHLLKRRAQMMRAPTSPIEAANAVPAF